MGLLDGILGGVVGAGMTELVRDVIEKHGGVSGIVSELQSKGLGETVQSWVSTGPNQAISPDQIHQILGSDTVTNLAGKLGISPDVVASKLAELLPQTVDKMTPDGRV